MLGDTLNIEEIELLINAGCSLEGDCIYYRGKPVGNTSMNYSQIMYSINSEFGEEVFYS